MNNQSQLLEASVEALKNLRTEVHGKVEDSVIERIDEIIDDLEASKRYQTRQYSAVELLILLGTVIEHLPAIAKAIEYLMQVAK